MPNNIRDNSAALSEQQLLQLGALGIQTVKARIASATNASDGGAAPYSNKRKVYVPRTGAGRSKSSLKGREVITPKDRAAMKKAGVSFKATKNSIVFANYSAYKKALGKSGNRDLELSGKMLGAVAIVEQDANHVAIGFTREEEAQKMLGNERREHMWAFSPNDTKVILDKAEAMTVENFQGLDIGR